MTKKRYNKNIYKRFKNFNAVVRDKITPNPFDSIKKNFLCGRLVNEVCNEITKKPIHKLAFNTTNKFYDKKNDSPYKGSILYTIFKVLYCGLLGFIIKLFILVLR